MKKITKKDNPKIWELLIDDFMEVDINIRKGSSYFCKIVSEINDIDWVREHLKDTPELIGTVWISDTVYRDSNYGWTSESDKPDVFYLAKKVPVTTYEYVKIETDEKEQ